MALPKNTVRKLLRDHFPGDKPIYIAEDGLSDIEDQIRAHLSRFRDVDVEVSRRYYAPQSKAKTVCDIVVRQPNTGLHYSYRRSNRFYIGRMETGQLTIDADGNEETIFISSMDEISDFVATCHERLDRRDAQSNKKGKIRDLTVQGVRAQIKKIANREKFAFHVRSDKVKIVLNVRLSNKDNTAIEFHLPYQDYDELLLKIPEAVRTARTLQEMGMKFQVHQKRVFFTEPDS
ncbi:MAG: hypothetical protein AAF639_02835 [Chloroflexota bacterium]